MVGIKGTGMAALAEILSSRGAHLTGSDVADRFYTDEILARLGLIALPFGEDNVGEGVDLVIHSSAYSAETNGDLAKAKRLGLPTLMYTEALGEISRTFYSAGICGVHGKTTTTGMAGTLLAATGLPAQVLAGSVISSFGGSCVMTTDEFARASPSSQRYFVAETCEYKRHFMSFWPRVIALTSVESDHQDYYPDYASIRAAFVDYACKLPQGGTLIYCADDAGAAEAAHLAQAKRGDIALIPYGMSAGGAFGVRDVRVAGGQQAFAIECAGECRLCVPGEHNVKNAAAAFALARELLKADGRNPDEYTACLKATLMSFTGAKRRSEVVAMRHNSSGDEVIFIDDYAHHPTAIRTTLAGFRQFYAGRRIIVDFMSHTFSRTEALFDEFASSFSDADFVVINEIYASARENPTQQSVSGAMLAQAVKRHNPSTVFAATFSEAACAVQGELEKHAAGGYVFVTMGAGDNWKVGSLLLEHFQA